MRPAFALFERKTSDERLCCCCVALLFCRVPALTQQHSRSVGLDGCDYVTHYGGRRVSSSSSAIQSVPSRPFIAGAASGLRGVSGKIDFLAHVAGFYWKVLGDRRPADRQTPHYR